MYESKKALLYESIFHFNNDEILVGVDGVWINGEKVFTPSTNIIDADIDEHGSIWLSTFRDGVYHIQKNYFTNYIDQRITNSYSIIQDGNHNLWIGSFENGLTKINGINVTRYTKERSGLPSNILRMLAPLKEGRVLASVWGTVPLIIDDGQISQLDDFWPLFATRTNVTEGFYESDSERWWLGTLHGLYIKEENRFLPFFDSNQKTLTNVSRIVPSPYNDDLFFCTKSDGLVLLRNNTFYFLSKKLPPTSRNVRDAYLTSPDTIWAAAYSGGSATLHYK